MKTIQEIASEKILDAFDPDEILPARAGYLVSLERRGFVNGARYMRKELTRWHDPKEDPPRNNVCVLLKVVDQLDNEAIYLGSREGVEYMTDGGLVFGTDFDDKSMPDMNVKVIGWREIM